MGDGSLALCDGDLLSLARNAILVRFDFCKDVAFLHVLPFDVVNGSDDTLKSGNDVGPFKGLDARADFQPGAEGTNSGPHTPDEDCFCVGIPSSGLVAGFGGAATGGHNKNESSKSRASCETSCKVSCGGWFHGGGLRLIVVHISVEL